MISLFILFWNTSKAIFLDADHFALVAVSVSFLGKWFVAELAFEWHAVFMDSDVVEHVAELREAKWAVFAL